jgi:hypothetical protein
MCIETDVRKSAKQNTTNDVQGIVIKQLASCERHHNLYITMKTIVNFYSTILAFIQSDKETDGAVAEIVALAKKAAPSWEATEESVLFLEQCCNRGSTVNDDDLLFTTLNEFMKASFRDLSVLKDATAMELFQKLASEVSPAFSNGEDMLIWARTVKERPDGSAVIVLHVSDMKRFRKLIERHDFADSTVDDPTLESGVVIGS